jgi:hypothetical protein
MRPEVGAIGYSLMAGARTRGQYQWLKNELERLKQEDMVLQFHDLDSGWDPIYYPNSPKVRQSIRDYVRGIMGQASKSKTVIDAHEI